MNGTAIQPLMVWSNRDGVSGYQVIYRPHRAVSSIFPSSDIHWHKLYNLKPCARPWIAIYEEGEFDAYSPHDI